MIPAIGSGLPGLQTSGISATQGAGAAAFSGAPAAASQDFASVMKEVAGDAINTMKSAEQMSIQGVQGNASTQAVVEAVMSAERTLQTAVTIRDKVVTAYLELSRMAI
ncbi:flagellar hook-basal body protein FliE [Aureimonas sp. Leaf454]|uniref:flagellar hook-basal body complex protein FliE n=1 Tax=Aureimonas sp. Leaf454 TaxID=1736381 RepID=UPI0006F6E556|nr:flagellar hook-basal body complex protein FliE [Aureimonas sp. Leaf454]KQT45187.1 flagellar hook-basal body protein FliE [Aureimonas sp. Leaf454]